MKLTVLAGCCVFKCTYSRLRYSDWSLPSSVSMLVAVLEKHFKDFIALLNIFFCTGYLRGASFFQRSNSHRGITLPLCLSKKEVRELTLKVRYSVQARTLSEMGIRHTLRPDGSPVVLYSTLKDLMDNPKRESNQPDFSSLLL